MTEVNKTQEVIDDAKRVIELLQGNSELQDKFAFVKLNASDACKSVNSDLTEPVNKALFALTNSTVDNELQKSAIVDALQVIIKFLEQAFNK